MSKVYTIKEYDSFTRNKKLNMENFTALPEHTFDCLEQFGLSNKSNNGTEALELMTVSSKRGIGKIISAKNYVGIIFMNDGTVIEILPKIYSQTEICTKQSKKILFDMLKSLKDSPFKSLQSSDMQIEKLPIFEVFISMFLKEIFSIVKRGLKCSYESIERNENFFKGKVLFSKHIKYNFAHKEKTFIEYDEFNNNRPENRLIKATLEFLYHRTNSSKNKGDIKTLLNCFSEVKSSKNYKNDFERIIIDRNNKDYTIAIRWCKVFLSGKSFSAFTGNEIAAALLFPMEVLFESFVASKLSKYLDRITFTMSTQDKSYYLFDYPKKKFLMKPDIVVKNNINKDIFVLDTKWKVLSETKCNYGILQSDMYQMYAYQKKYLSRNVILLYPNTDKIPSTERFEFEALDGALIKIRFIDLMDIKGSIAKVIDEFINVSGERFV